MDGLCYYARRGVAIVLACVLTGYGAWLSWSHFHSILGPLVAVSAAILLALAPHGRRFAWALWGLGIAAAVISATAVIDRVTATDAVRLQQAHDTNHPKAVAQQALDDAKAELKSAEGDAKAECVSGRRRRCAVLEEREEAARQRVEMAREIVVKSGAQREIDPIVSLFGVWAETYRKLLPLSLPMWLEIAAPVLMSYGFAPLQRSGNPARTPLQRKAPEPLQPALQHKAPRKGRRKAPSYGTVAYWLARLDRDRPDLATLVRAGTMSANAAAIRAGFRKPALRVVA
jgi:hypothetical protein